MFSQNNNIVWKLTEAVCFTVIIIFLSGLYGFIPTIQAPNLGIWYITWGIAQSLANQPFPFLIHLPDVLFPYGYPQLQGFLVHWLIASFIQIFSVSDINAGNIAGIVFLSLSLFSFISLMKLLDVRKWIGYMCGVIFLVTPFVFKHMGYGSMGLGFMLVPLSLFADLYLIKNVSGEVSIRTKNVIKISGIVFIFRLLLVGVDWYSIVISFVGGGVIILYYSVYNLVRKTNPSAVLVFLIAWILTWAGGVLPWYFAMPQSGLTEPIAMGMFRAQGVDIITLLVPRGELLWANLLDFPKNWQLFEFFGDGSNSDYNYLGYIFLTSLIISIVLIAKRSDKNILMIPLILAGIVCFVISLGPSLKVDSRRVIDKHKTEEITFEDYHMPEEKALMNMPTSFIYKIFPVSIMRAVYRWLIFFIIVLIISFGWMIEQLLALNMLKPAVVFLVLGVVETFPNYPEVFSSHTKLRKAYYDTENSIINNLKEQVKEGDKVFFLSKNQENDYLASWIGAHLKVKSYNGGGDKNNWLALPYMPEVIKRLKNYNNYENIENAHSIALALRSKVADKIVVPYFSLRWDASHWPPESVKVVNLSREFSGILELLPEDIQKVDYNYFTVLIPTVTMEDRQVHFNEEINSVVQFILHQPVGSIFITDGADASLEALLSNKSNYFFDYRDSDSINKTFKSNRPVFFINSFYKKYFDTPNIDKYTKLFENDIVFKTEDCWIARVTPYKYFRLIPDYVVDEETSLKIGHYINSNIDTSEIRNWVSFVDFSVSDFQNQLCYGWYDLEKSGSGNFRWIGKSAALFLRVPNEKPQELFISMFPILDYFDRKEVNLTVKLDDVEVLNRRIIENKQNLTISCPLGDNINLSGKVKTVVLELDQTYRLQNVDERNLGIIVSRIGFQ